MKAKQFDTEFDAGKEVSGALDLAKARRPKHEPNPDLTRAPTKSSVIKNLA
jgi:hypothetical protein